MMLEFKPEHYNKWRNVITIQMPDKFYIENIRHKLDHGQFCIQEIDVKSPSGKVETFKIVGEHAGGIRYKNDKTQINLIR